jgi:hypothetical protein
VTTTRRALGAVGLLIAAAFPRAAGAQVDGEPTVEKEKCPLGKGRAVHVVTTTDPESCGSGGCGQSQAITVEDRGGRVLLGLGNELGDFSDAPDLGIACEAGGVEVTDAKGTVVAFKYVPAKQQLALPAAVRDRIEAGWRQPAATGDAADERVRLGEALGRVLPAQGTTEVAGLDVELVRSLRLLEARDKIEAGAWESGEGVLNSVMNATPPPTPATPLARRAAALAARLAALREKSAPLVVTEHHRIGTTLKRPVLPLDGKPTVFWRGDAVCVAQEDADPPKAMRCLDAPTRRWATREPMQVPRSSGDHLRTTTYPNVDRCEGIYVMQATVPDDPNDRPACNGGPGEPEADLVAVVDGDAMVLANNQGVRVNRAPGKTEALTTEQALALIRTSAGTLLAGNGCCRFVDDGRLVRLAQDSAEHRWEVRGPPPKDQNWASEPLVSPSQDFAVVMSQNRGQPLTAGVTLWLLRLTRRP